MASIRDARMSWTSRYSIFLAWLYVRLKKRPTTRSHSLFCWSTPRGTTRNIDFASTTALIVFLFDGERNSLKRDNAASKLLGMTKPNRPKATFEKLGTVLLRIAGKLAEQKILGDARTGVQVVPTTTGIADGNAAQAGQSQSQAPRLREEEPDAPGWAGSASGDAVGHSGERADPQHEAEPKPNGIRASAVNHFWSSACSAAR